MANQTLKIKTMNRLLWGDPDLPDPSQLTPEQRELLRRAFDQAMPKLDPATIKGVIVVFGTGSPLDGDAHELFMSRPVDPDKAEEEVGKLVRYYEPQWPIQYED